MDAVSKMALRQAWRGGMAGRDAFQPHRPGSALGNGFCWGCSVRGGLKQPPKRLCNTKA